MFLETFTIHFTIHSTVHLEFCLFKGGCPLSFLLQNFLPLELLPLEAFFERKFLASTTTISYYLTILYLGLEQGLELLRSCIHYYCKCLFYFQ